MDGHHAVVPLVRRMHHALKMSTEGFGFPSIHAVSDPHCKIVLTTSGTRIVKILLSGSNGHGQMMNRSIAVFVSVAAMTLSLHYYTRE
jgi:hypothetical protein